MMTDPVGRLSRPQMERLVERGILSKAVVGKAERLLREGAVTLDREAGGSVYFAVGGHDIIYRRPQKKWLCDCPFFSVKTKYCSHILAVHLFLDDDESKNPL